LLKRYFDIFDLSQCSFHHIYIKVFIKERGHIRMKCPGQDLRYWGKDSIFEEKCPKCGNSVEFFKMSHTGSVRDVGISFLTQDLILDALHIVNLQSSA